MEVKKAPEHDLTKKTGLFLNLGLTLSLLIVILAFEWPDSGNDEIMDFGELETDFEDIMEIPPTEQPPPPPPKVQIPEIVEVPDEEEIEEEIEVELDVEVTEETVVEDIVFEEAPEEEEVDEIFARLKDAGVDITTPPHKAFWGGYSGYFADPEGNAWEVAYNPFWKFDEAGRVILLTKETA